MQVKIRSQIGNYIDAVAKQAQTIPILATGKLKFNMTLKVHRHEMNRNYSNNTLHLEYSKVYLKGSRFAKPSFRYRTFLPLF
ncbi:hypothetical protein ABKN59_011134 [Abortiporus biennis]